MGRGGFGWDCVFGMDWWGGCNARAHCILRLALNKTRPDPAPHYADLRSSILTRGHEDPNRSHDADRRQYQENVESDKADVFCAGAMLKK